eukprot:TRINITY_DN756_c0_g1_i2.p2 TRINITY_DN756_c0_g1~~TRINITY_DN756_c0_g1_i2.p2  ORF type:complete len:122 (-),score=28.86 TRINITY_DN756_c0_g1_i2:515-880(-)
MAGGAVWLANCLKRLPDALRPTKVNGRWRKPEFSALQIARIRKAGGSVEMDAALAEVRPRKEPRAPKPPKGRKSDRLKPERLAKVESNLARQPELMAKMKEQRVAQALVKAKKNAMGNPTI